MNTAPSPSALKKKPLAKALGLSRTTLLKYLKEPGAPKPNEAKEYDVEETKSFCRSRAAKSKAGNTVVKLSAMEALRMEKLKDEIEYARYKTLKERGEYIHRDEITSTFEPIVAGIRADLQKFFEDELPPQYKGRTRAECQQLNAAAVDKIIENIRNGAAPVINQATVKPAEKATG